MREGDTYLGHKSARSSEEADKSALKVGEPPYAIQPPTLHSHTHTHGVCYMLQCDALTLITRARPRVCHNTIDSFESTHPVVTPPTALQHAEVIITLLPWRLRTPGRSRMLSCVPPRRPSTSMISMRRTSRNGRRTRE